jgi:molybdopterin molybdotransferase
MLDVDSALDLILAEFAPLPVVSFSLLEACGLVLSEDVVARDDVPPFRNAAMDGYAVRACDTIDADWQRPVTLRAIGEIAAGEAKALAVAPGTAVRIMTGAPLPAGADAVVRFEETNNPSQFSEAATTVEVFRPAKPGDNVREAGEDIAAGSVVLRQGRQLSPADVGVLAAVGRPTAVVQRRPVVAVLSTGDEVLDPDEDLAPGKIHNSNAYVLAAMARAWGAIVAMLGIARDDRADLSTRLQAATQADLIVTSGGVSLGDYDLVKDVLRSEGEVAIWQVRMKPGKPLAFGRVRHTPLLGLPGNPVAAAVSFLLFGRPAIRKMLGHADLEPPLIDVVAAGEIDNRGQRRHYVRVRLESDAAGVILARSAGEQGAGMLRSLAAANALLVVPEVLEQVQPGTRLKAIPLDW